MKKGEKTTIQLKKETRRMLKNAQKYPRETYDYTIKQLIKESRK